MTEFCTHFNYIEVIGESERNYGLYRIMPTETRQGEESITYKCEHVFATLLDDIMEGYHQYTNYTTTQVLQFILDLQEVKRWELGIVEFTRYFSYSFENENGLLAPVLSIPKPFDEPYEFTFDTTVYPWKLNLVQASNDVKAEIRWGKDILDFMENSDPTDIVNYLIPKGYGEGVNQLDISSVNGGVKYLQDTESIAMWGKRPYIWIDRRFEDAQSLKDNAQSLLNQWKDPKISFECDSVDLSIKDEYKDERKVLNGVTSIIVEDRDYQGRIISEEISDLSKEYDVKYEINNKLDDIADAQVDLERKQQVNEAYSQGATNIGNYDYCDNADENFPAVIKVYLPNEMVRINKMFLNYQVDKFRAYSKATLGGGAVTDTTAAGGSVEKSTTDGGSSTTTSTTADNHRHMMFRYSPDIFVGAQTNTGYECVSQNGTNLVWTYFKVDTAFDMYTYGAEGGHNHEINIPAHSHNVVIDPHTHPITLEDHSHPIDYGIFTLDTLPSSMSVRVDGNIIPNTSLNENEIDIIPYLAKTSGKVNRGWHTIEITPSSKARITANVISQFFIQSRGGGDY